MGAAPGPLPPSFWITVRSWAKGVRFALLVTVFLAVPAGLISLAGKALVPEGKPAFCVPFGIALLVYAALAAFALALIQAWHSTSRRIAVLADGSSRPKENSEDKWKEVTGFVATFLGALFLLGLTGVLLYASGSAASPQVVPFWHEFGHLAGMAMMTALGFFAVGSLVGFLFGLPRSGTLVSPFPKLTDKSKPGDEASAAGAAPASGDSPALPQQETTRENTNLEEVSDWLTKIIVGVGLVEIKSAPRYAALLLGFYRRECGSEICGGVLLMMGLFFSILGFLASYLLARVYVKLTIIFTDRISKLNTENIARETAERTATATVKAGNAQPDGSDTRALTLINEARVLVEKYDSKTEKKDTATSEAILSRALSFAQDAEKYGPNYLVLLRKGRILKRQAELKNNDRQLLQQALDATTESSRLRPNYFAAWYNMACYKALLGQPREEVLGDLKKAISILPSLVDEAATDPDLISLGPTEERRTLLRGMSSPGLGTASDLQQG